jgi:hypothetical protein
MAKKKVQRTKGGNKKHGRSKKKQASKGNPISNFVRGKITAEQYFYQIKITSKG